MLQRFTALAVCASIALTPMPAVFAQGVGQYNLPSLGTVAGADLTVLDERALGEQLMRRVRADPTYMSDPETTAYLNSLGYRLVAAGEVSPYDFFFFPIRDKSLNAFALPGGFIAVHSGLIVAAQSESELAGVIGHEVGHVTQRHIARMLEQGQSSWAMTLGSILLALLAARAGGSSGGDAAMGIMMGTQAAMIQKQLGYSRDAEREADRVGLESLTNAGFDPHGMEAFFERLQQNNRWYESASLAYISTHPMTSERMSDMQNRTRLMPNVQHRDSIDFFLIQARMRVLQETRFDGWQQVAKSFENDLKTNLTKAQRAAANSRMNQNVKALPYAREAKKLVGNDNVIVDKNLSELTFAVAKTDAQKNEALRLAQDLVKKYPYSGLAVTNCAELLYQAGRHEDVIKLMRNQSALSKNDADYYAYLARSYEALGQKSLSFAATGDMYALMNNPEAAVYQFDLAQKANDADFYVMSEIDAKLREQRRRVLDMKKD
ncbi:MAG: M48 family metalloprotease [Sutterellaceae bacterium]|nr:M48 family metalloprotease [Sutterellaceae bacterium]